MKKIFSLTILYFLTIYSVFTQVNLIPNPGFENEKPNRSPMCLYSALSGSNFRTLEDDIEHWINARTISGQNKNSSPDWMDLTCSKPCCIFYPSRFVSLEDKGGDFQDAIRTNLLNQMDINKTYVFKISYVWVPYKNSQPLPSAARIKVNLTKYDRFWNSNNSGNVKLQFDMFPPYYLSGGWVQHFVILDGYFLNIFGNIFNDLNNITLDCSEGAAYIDYVELSENCPNPLLIENHQFYNNVNEIPYKAASILKAGYDVGNPLPNGNVVVNSFAKAKFKAESQIILEPGFIVEEGADFETIFEPCNSNTAKVDNEIIVIDDKTIQIGDITIYDDRVETLACNDTLRIYGLDGDTTSFVNYFWDFGNGQTSDNPVGEMFYENPGEYTVKLALTDSAGVIDTLSKIYIQPDCKGKTNRLSNDTTNNESNTVSYLSPTIFPNPTPNNINITQLNNFVSGNIEIINLMGQVIFSQSIQNHQMSVNLSAYNKGIYLVKISSDKQQIIEKIVLE